VINERGRINAENTKSWDKVIGVIYLVLMLGGLAVAGLDARLGWSQVPLGLKVLGGVAVTVCMGLIFWVMTANTFLSSMVRIQDDRGHTTITSGPYRYVRHPMYAGMLLMFWGIPLLLGSWWGLLLGVLTMILYIVRTALEDKTLQKELPGYIEYTRQTRYRLIPGIW
jgi:protein-S-isoprenylcysteine O-methyltransferase Ste14